MGPLCKVLFYASTQADPGSSSLWGWGHADVSWVADGWLGLTEYTSLLAVAKEQQEWRKTGSDIQTLEISLWASALFRKCPRVLINSRLWMKMAFYSAHVRLCELQIRLTSFVYLRFTGNIEYCMELPCGCLLSFSEGRGMSVNSRICVLSTHVRNVFACAHVCAFMHVWWDSAPPPCRHWVQSIELHYPSMTHWNVLKLWGSKSNCLLSPSAM